MDADEKAHSMCTFIERLQNLKSDFRTVPLNERESLSKPLVADFN